MGRTKRCLSNAFLVGVAALAGLASSAAPETERDVPTVPRIEGEWSIDGALDEPEWTRALAIELPYEWFPGDGAEPPVRTVARLAYDSRHFYVSFEAFDPDPSAIRAHYMDRDEIETFVQDDHVSVMLDTFNDERRAVQFRVNPLGVQADALFSENEGIEDFSWDVIWSSAGRITENGYEVEIALPLNQLRFPASDGPLTWGVELSRSYPRNVRHRISANLRDRDRNCLLCQLGKIGGLTGLKQGKGLEFAPTMTAGRLDRIDAFPGGRLQEGDDEIEFGLSARWSVTSGLTLNVAANPDFSQVEADSAQLSVNERFALFFPEKRPFFLEGSDVFASPLGVVFTRTVADPRFGAKFTGKQDRHALGVFVARDDTPPAVLLPGSASSRFAILPDDELDSAVLRYRLDVGRNSTVGVIATSREGDRYRNRVGGLDGFFRLGRKHSIRFQALRSDTRYPSSFSALVSDLEPDDRAWTAEYAFADRFWNASLALESLGAGFRADAGFLPRVDTDRASAFGSRTWYPKPGFPLNRVRLGGFYERRENRDGALTDQTRSLFVNFNGSLQSFAELALERTDVAFGGALFRDVDRIGAYGQLQPTGDLKLALFVETGDGIDFVGVRPGDLDVFAPNLEWRIGRHLNARIDHTRQTLDVAGGRLFRADLTELRLVWQFNTRAFVRAIVQRQALRRDLGLYDACVSSPSTCPFAADDEDRFLQVLGSYKLDPQTVVFLGYSENRTDAENLGGTAVVSPDLVRTDRFFFLKLGYAWTL